MKGFDNYIKASAVSAAANSAGGTVSGSAIGGGLGAGRRKPVINDTDRVFTRSSVSYMRDSDSPSSATSTPHAGTPTASFTTEKGDKKKKKSAAAAAAAAAAANDDDTDTKSNKRQKITFGGSRKGHDD